MPTRYEDIYRSDYIAPEDIPHGGIRGVTFYKAEERELHCVGVKQGWKVVLFAKDSTGKPLKRLIAVNKSSAKQLSKAWGKPIESYDCWLGKLADLTHVQIRAFGALKDAVLITPVVKAVEGERWEDASSEAIEPLRRPQSRAVQNQQIGRATRVEAPPVEAAAPVQTPPIQEAPPPVETVDENTGEVYVDANDAGQEQPLDEIMVTNVAMKDGKRPNGTPYRVYFITCSDGKTYTSFDDHKPNAEGLLPHEFAQMAKDQKRGVLITAEAVKINKAGKEYYPIVSIA